MLTALVNANACVVGGSLTDVSNGLKCCSRVSVAGKWFSGNPHQGICVLTADVQSVFEGCVDYFAAGADSVCIVCDETQDCGLLPTS
jgi:hypothetical protein